SCCLTSASSLLLAVCTLTAALQKVFSSVPALRVISDAWTFSDAAAAGRILAPAKTLEEMYRVIFNDYVDATLSALFVALVVAMVVYGLIGIRRALQNPQVTAIEVGLGAVPGASHA